LEFLGGISQELLDSWIETQEFPRPLNVSRRVLLWDKVLVDAWLDRKGKESQATAA
jgi:predicted DNA-binding transcriptional regulator AlpA